MEGRHGVQDNMFHVCFMYVSDFWNFLGGIVRIAEDAEGIVRIADGAEDADGRGFEYVFPSVRS